MYEGFEIIDFHSHFPTDRPWFPEMGNTIQNYVDKVGEKRARLVQEMSKPYGEQWRRMWGFPHPEGKDQHPGDREQARRWAEELETYGIRSIGFVTGGGNEHLAEIVSWYPDKFVGFAHHDPFLPDAVERLDHAVRTLGLRGYKLLAPMIDHPIEDEAAWPVWEKCAELEIPVLIHFGIQGGAGGIAWHENINPFKLHPIAKAFPDVTFVIPHFGCAWERETLQLCWACPNVSVDTSGSLQWIRWVPGEVTVKYLFRKFYETVGPERIIFGTDSSWFPRGFAFRYLQDQLRDCLDLNMPDAHVQQIFAGNAARLLKINLST
jgi:predicted TIM-barrel fold metal-dependent hydrolase